MTSTSSSLSSEVQNKAQDFWYDIDKNRYFILNNGQVLNCNSMGIPLAHFMLYGSGHYSYHERLRHALKASVRGITIKRPQCLSKIGKKLLYTPAHRKFDGYTQFPRPLAYSRMNRSVESRLKNTRYNFTLEKPEPKSMLKITKRSSIPHTTFLTKPDQSTTLSDVNESTIKTLSNHLPSINVKFSRFKMNKSYEIPSTEKVRTYKGIMEKLKNEENNKEGYKKPLEKANRMMVRGIYDISVSTEMELYEKQLERRKLINPMVYSEVKRKEELDRLLLEKLRDRKISLVKSIRMSLINRQSKLTSK